MFHRIALLLLTVCIPFTGGLSAQVLPLIGGFRNSTFQGTLDVSWPVLFDNCTFVTDSIVLRHSYGALFRNCTFESRSGQLYLAESGSGMILVDCEATGCNEVRFSLKQSDADRNYVCGIKVNGDECIVLDDQDCIIDIEGLEVEESVRGESDGPLIMIMSADRMSLKAGETAMVQVYGLTDGMFVGWHSSNPELTLSVDDPFICKVTAPQQIETGAAVVISAYTEYGLEAACEILLMPDQKEVSKEKSRKNKKRK